MNQLYEGVFDTKEVQFELPQQKVDEILSAVENLLPGASAEFEEICLNTKHLFIAHKSNQVAKTRRGISNLLKHLTKAKNVYDELSPLGVSKLSPEFSFELDTLIAKAEATCKACRDLPNGKQPFDYRYDLASKIAQLMRKFGQEPGVVRFIDSKKNTSKQPYDELFQHAVRLIERVITDRTFDYLEYGITSQR